MCQLSLLPIQAFFGAGLSWWSTKLSKLVHFEYGTDGVSDIKDGQLNEQLKQNSIKYY